MIRSIRFVLLAATLVLLPRLALGQGGYGGRSAMTQGRYGPSAPKLPGVELAGPLDSATARVLLSLNDQEAAHYAQVYDSFMVATRPARDSAATATAKMNERLEAGDLAAAMFYAERLQDVGKYLKDRQDRFESDLRRFLTGDQVKSYRKWKEAEEHAAEQKRREDDLRWQEAAISGGSFRRSEAPTPEPKASVPTVPGVATPELGAQVVHIGRTVYVANQLGVDSAGTLAGADLKTQAIRAFENLTTVLRLAGTSPRDVVSLTIYVVNYRSADLATIREAGAAYFGPNPPIAAVLGVQSVGRDGALISVGATAMSSAASFLRERP
jgi:enamine deaminase RidA (YjgF/YER057c/UK114 family)